jgi:hypothetical protein
VLLRRAWQQPQSPSALLIVLGEAPSVRQDFFVPFSEAQGAIKARSKFKERYYRNDVIDPISLDGIDDSNEWLIGKMGAQEVEEDELVFEDDELTWAEGASAAGFGEPSKPTRSQSKSKRKFSAIEEEDDNKMEQDIDCDRKRR